MEKVGFIRSAQAIGFSLEDIGTLLKLETGGGRARQEQVAALLRKRLAETETRLNDLTQVRTALVRALDRCGGSRSECAVMQDLNSKQKRRTR